MRQISRGEFVRVELAPGTPGLLKLGGRVWLAADGEQVPWHRYYDRRWREGSILVEGEAYKRPSRVKMKGGGIVVLEDSPSAPKPAPKAAKKSKPVPADAEKTTSGKD